jgi:cytochrome c553
MLKARHLVAICLALLSFSSALSAAPKAQKKPTPATSEAAAPALKADPEIGQLINGVCAGCHGASGEGGKKGEYPRLAGQSFEYLKIQLTQFKGRNRTNMPMFPYTEERELSDADIVHISSYLSEIRLETTIPVFKEDEDALVRLTRMAKVFRVPRAEGNIEAGAKSYRLECAPCHASKGAGKKENPMLAGQYTQYLKRQIDKYIAGERIHDLELKDRQKDVLNLLKQDEIRDILAYLSTLND